MKPKQEQKLPHNKPETTSSLEKSEELVPIEWVLETKSPYGKCISENTIKSGDVEVILATFSKGKLLIVKNKERNIFSKFLEDPIDDDSREGSTT